MTRLGTRGAEWIVGCAALVCGAAGAIVGVVIGLLDYAPTAWAAALEIGIPAALAGALIGLMIAGLRATMRRART